MDLHHHANRYYKSLCLCDFPMRSKFARDLCGECGGIIPRWRQLEVEQAEERAGFHSLIITILICAGMLFMAMVVGDWILAQAPK
ncbi:MAG: hypothetical protein KatS3mg023_3908 [Armatimonadota bacterium]|nr:MAG: hypothetical protein KatS3mg023_3908 [Armatimonadota bacterium]